jgi:hypothetical protein
LWLSGRAQLSGDAESQQEAREVAVFRGKARQASEYAIVGALKTLF